MTATEPKYTYLEIYSRVMRALRTETPPATQEDYYFDPETDAPRCAVGLALYDDLFPIRNDFSTARVNSQSISYLLTEGALSDWNLDPLAQRLLEFVQDLNDEGHPWPTIVRAIHKDELFSHPSVVPQQSELDLAATTGGPA